MEILGFFVGNLEYGGFYFWRCHFFYHGDAPSFRREHRGYSFAANGGIEQKNKFNESFPLIESSVNTKILAVSLFWRGIKGEDFKSFLVFKLKVYF